MTEPAPSPQAGRDAAIDALRGAALFGILFVNIDLFAFPHADLMVIRPDWPAPADRLAQAAITALVAGKFFTIFAFVFGWAAFLQIVRDEAGPSRFQRRLAAFAIIGALHFLLLSIGDIVLPFAIVGAFLLRSADWAENRLARNALIWFAVTSTLYLVIAGLHLAFPAEAGELDPAVARRGAIYASGTLAAVLGQHMGDAVSAPWMPLTQAAIAVPIARYGFLLARRVAIREGTLAQTGGAAMRGAVASYAAPFAVPALAINGLGALVVLLSDDLALRGVAVTLVFTIGGVLLAPLYIRFLLDRFADPRHARWRDRLAVIGRMSLSVYIGQSLAAALAFHGYGLGLLGRLGPVGVVGMAIMLNLAVFVLALGWSRAFGQGPLERLLVLAGGHRREPKLRTLP